MSLKPFAPASASIEQQALAYFQQSLAYRDSGQLRQALQGFRHVLKLLPQRKTEVAHGIGSILAQIAPTQYQPELRNDLLLCFAEPSIDHQGLASITALQLLAHYQLSSVKYGESIAIKPLLDDFCNDTLLNAFLCQCINIEAAMENMLLQLRQHCLQAVLNRDDVLTPALTELIAAIGHQVFANQAIWPVSKNETALLLDLQSSSHPQAWLVRAMYQPLIEQQGLDSQNLAKENSTAVNSLLQRTLIEPNAERQLAQKIPSFSNIGNEVSVAVRAQYEACPYPRWTLPPASQLPPLTHILQQLPKYQVPLQRPEHIELLVAGCGTGYEPIEISRMQNNLTVTAIDLSRKSLAYGLNKAQQLAIDNVRFMHGDILQVGQLQQQFDVVVSTGVLHHMADTEAGWQSLVNVTKPAGVMRISLYSELGRRRIVRGRDSISKMGLSSSLQDMQRYREFIFTEARGELAELAKSDDLYSLSGCRDLLFHEQEHRFSFLQISAMAKRLGLRFIGLDWPNAEVYQQFNAMFPHADAMFDFENWHQFEQQNPDAFLTMYQLWWQKTE